MLCCQHDPAPSRSSDEPWEPQFDLPLYRSPERAGTCPRSPSTVGSQPSSNLVHLPSSLESFLLCCKGTDPLVSSAWVAVKINYPEYVHHQRSSKTDKGGNEMCHTCSWGIQAVSLMTPWSALHSMRTPTSQLVSSAMPWVRPIARSGMGAPRGLE